MSHPKPAINMLQRYISTRRLKAHAWAGVVPEGHVREWWVGGGGGSLSEFGPITSNSFPLNRFDLLRAADVPLDDGSIDHPTINEIPSIEL